MNSEHFARKCQIHQPIQKKKKETLETAKRKDLKKIARKEERDRETITSSDRRKENNK